VARRIFADCQTPSEAADEFWVSAESGRGIRRRILDAACVVRHFRSCLEHNRRGGNHSLFEGGELSVGHIAEPFRYRVSRKMQIQGLRWAAIAAVQKRRRGGEACRILSFVRSTSVSTAKPENLRASITRLPTDSLLISPPAKDPATNSGAAAVSPARALTVRFSRP
jgi:hypothetical protein